MNALGGAMLMAVEVVHRRKRAEMLRLRVAMHTLALQGKSRKYIALTLDATPAQVTRILGPERPYKSYRRFT